MLVRLWKYVTLQHSCFSTASIAEGNVFYPSSTVPERANIFNRRALFSLFYGSFDKAPV